MKTITIFIDHYGISPDGLEAGSIVELLMRLHSSDWTVREPILGYLIHPEYT